MVVQHTLGRVMQSLLALSGLAGESMVRDPGWRFMDAGRRIERGLQLAALLRATVTVERSTATDSLLLESVLIAAESIITYRRRYRSHAQLETLLDLLLLDADNPRSLAYQLDQLADDVRLMPSSTRGPRLSEPERLVLEASTALRLADTAALARPHDDGIRPELDDFLAQHPGVAARATADAIDADHFVHPLPQHSLVVVVTYRVVHRTEYSYESEVTVELRRAVPAPARRAGPGVPSSSVRIEPEPHDYRERTDFFGNRAAYFAVLEPHTRLTVTAESVVDVNRPGTLPLPVDQAVGGDSGPPAARSRRRRVRRPRVRPRLAQGRGVAGRRGLRGGVVPARRGRSPKPSPTSRRASTPTSPTSPAPPRCARRSPSCSSAARGCARTSPTWPSAACGRSGSPAAT